MMRISSLQRVLPTKNLSLFNLHFLVDNKNNVVDNEDLEMHRKQIYYLTDEKKKKCFIMNCVNIL